MDKILRQYMQMYHFNIRSKLCGHSLNHVVAHPKIDKTHFIAFQTRNNKTQIKWNI